MRYASLGTLARRLVVLAAACTSIAFAGEQSITLDELTDTPRALSAEIGEDADVTWWLPKDADAYVLPIAGGIEVRSSDKALVNLLGERSPWSLATLPAIGARYGDQMIVVLVPWPHYAELIVEERLGIRYTFPADRRKASPCEIVVVKTGADPLNVAKVFREWRRTAPEIGVIPRPRSLTEKIQALPKVERLLGAPHLYLWGAGNFSLHDVPRTKWKPFARALLNAEEGSLAQGVMRLLNQDQAAAVAELAAAEWSMRYLTIQIANGIDKLLSERSLLGLNEDVPLAEVVRKNRAALAEAFREFVQPPETWGDGLSLSMLTMLQEAGIDRALLVLSNLYSKTSQPEVVQEAEKLGYLLGPYDSYHSIHSPEAHPDKTWETAQFGSEPFQEGRVRNRDGSGHGGFKGAGYHFSPAAAWPYVQKRVGSIRRHMPYSTWFVDCDATAECFDDYHSDHPTTRLEDTKLRRQRLQWLESDHAMVVGSEGGSALFADVIHYGHGVHTPYIGHLDKRFRDRESPYYLGRYWPRDTPEQSFKAVKVPPNLKSPYFDPTVRIPLYQAAFGDELLATHHWSFDSLKFSDIAATRQLLEILYMVPPMFHLSRESWATRKGPLVKHHTFWSPIHKAVGTAPLTHFEHLTPNRLLQRTTFQTAEGAVTLTVNFDTREHLGYPSQSATVQGLPEIKSKVFRAAP